MTKKQVIRMIGFGLVVCFFLCILCDLFELKNSSNYDKRFTTFRNLNEDTVDAVIIGTSGTDRYWITPKGYEDYGMTTYVLASDEMPSWLFRNVIDDIYAYQNPELIIIDLRVFAQDNTDEERLDTRVRRLLDSMNFYSVTRFQTAFEAMRVMHETFPERDRFDISFLLSYVKYHTMWSEDDYTLKKHWGNREHEYLGFYMDKELGLDVVEQDKVVYDKELYKELDPLAESSLYDLIEYAKVNNVELLFLDTPQFKDETEIGRANTVIKILEENNINYINYSETDEEGNFLYDLNLDEKTDFYNEGHVNYYGAEKFTTVFGKYLDENYDLEDRRNDPAVQEQWDGVYWKLTEKIYQWEEARKGDK